MRISGNEHSQVILSQTMWIQMSKMIAQKCKKKKLKQKGWCNNDHRNK